MPAVDCEFASKSAPDVVLMHSNIGSRNVQGLRQLSPDSSDSLGRHMREEVIGIRPLHDRTVRFETAMGDHTKAIKSLGNNIGFSKCSVGLALDQRSTFLIQRA